MYNTAQAEQRENAVIVERSVHTYHLVKNKEKARARAATRHRNMIKQRVCGVILVLCGVAPIMIDKDATVFIFLAMFYLPMIFGKQYIMTFKEQFLVFKYIK